MLAGPEPGSAGMGHFRGFEPPELLRPVDRALPDLADPPDLSADFEAGFFGVLGTAFFAVFFSVGLEELLESSELSLRCRRAASRRFPTPRPSRASCVGVEVDPEIFFSWGEVSAGASFDPPSVSDFPPSAESPDPSASEEIDSFVDPRSGGAVRPPTRIAAPVPISRRSFFRRHSGQVFSGSAVID